MTTRTRGEKLYVRIAQDIRKMIEDGSFRPGDRLPPLAQLAADFQCSRATVREALGALRGQGLVELRHGDGTYVRTAAMETWMEPLEAAVLLGVNQIDQLLQWLTALLAGAAYFAARRARDADSSVLAQALFQMECADPRDEESVVAEMAFYFALAQCTDNALLENTLRVLQEALRSSLRLVHTKDGTAVAVCRQVFDAIRAGDASLASEQMYQHGEWLMAQVYHKRTTATHGHSPADGNAPA